MRNSDDVAVAKLVLVRQLQRKDIGQSQQRALLHGMLSALEWTEGSSNGNAKALQRLFDGDEIAVNGTAQIGGAPLRTATERAQRASLVYRYQQETGDVYLNDYVAWLESQVTGVGLIVV